jgi:hypothetical protein
VRKTPIPSEAGQVKTSITGDDLKNILRLIMTCVNINSPMKFLHVISCGWQESKLKSAEKDLTAEHNFSPAFRFYQSCFFQYSEEQFSIETEDRFEATLCYCVKPSFV